MVVQYRRGIVADLRQLLQDGIIAPAPAVPGPRACRELQFLYFAFCTIVPAMNKWKQYLGIALVVYVLSIGPVFGFALSRQAYPAPLDQPTGRALQIAYFPVDTVADAIPLVGIPLRRYQVLWFRIFSR